MADALANRTAVKSVEDVLLTAIDTALRVRSFSVTGISGLRAVATMGASTTPSRTGGELAIISGSALYRWSEFSTASDNATTVIKPTDAGTAGRWLKQSNPGGTSTPLCLRGDDVAAIVSGYVQSVILAEGALDDEENRERTLNQRPTVVIDWNGLSRDNGGRNPGQLTKADFSFLVWVIDENLRGNLAASRGSEVGTEAAVSPGAYAIVGDITDLLDGTTGEQLGEPGIQFCRIESVAPGPKLLKTRHVVQVITMGVWGTISRRGSNAATLSALNVQMQHAMARPADEDADYNFAIIDGLRVSLGTGLSRAPSNGAAVVSGTTVTVSGAPLHTFTAWRDTYRDLRTLSGSIGSFVYAEVPLSSDAPAVASGAMRIGYTRTDSAGATEDVLLAPLLRNVASGIYSGTFSVAP